MQQQRRGAPWRWSETLSAVLALGAFGVLGTVLGGVVPLAAQVTYMVFPVQKVVSNRATGQPTGQKVTVEAKDSTVKFLVDEIARQAHLLPTYVHSAAFDRRISVQLHDLAAMDAFAVVLKGTGLVARLASDGETVMIRPNVQGGGVWHEFAGSISGSVTDSASGQGLGGAAVLVEGTKLSTVTSDSGHFTLRNVPVGDQVVSVKLFGYKPAQRTVTMVDSQRTMVRFVLVPVPTVLSGVVTTATGLQRKVEVGNDITTLNVDSIQRVAPVMSVTDLLETRVPGLTVMHTDGVPGDPSRLRLRGTGSIQLNNDPIIIIDGVRVYSQQSDPRTNNLAKTPTAAIGNGLPAANTASGSFAAPSPLDQIDPSSIESIEVLKGPSATAVYGSDAANGVIIITTKHGRAGPTHWDMALADGINYLPGKWPMNYYLYGKPIDAQGPVIIPSFCQWYDVTCRVDSVVGFQALNDPNLTLMSQGHDRNTSLNVSGGDPIMQYSATGSTSGTLGYLKLPGIEQQRYQQFYGSPVPGALLRPDNLNTWGLDGTVTVLPSHTMRVVFESRYYSSTQQQSTLQSALLTLASTPIDTAVLGTAPLITNEFDQAMDNQVTTQ
ncbi:MAG TPA: TonB-dependent receptor plug domain-containing protein, partial [Gemmatimonadaceae bacterium]|nr:TonB-dependent receptor plug domain-containing protein [Gemmatimonadaceae bacterium]